MTIVSDNLATLDNGRQKLVDVGLRPTRVWVRSGTWSEGEIHLGDLTEADTEITPRPKVEHRGATLLVSGITPEFSTGGWAASTLSPEPASGVDFYYVVQFNDGALDPYRLVSIDTTGAFGITLILEPLKLDTPDTY